MSPEGTKAAVLQAVIPAGSSLTLVVQSKSMEEEDLGFFFFFFPLNFLCEIPLGSNNHPKINSAVSKV